MTRDSGVLDPEAIIEGYALPTFVVDRVDSDHIRMVALLLDDPNPIHFDVAAAKAAGLGDRAVNQGGATMAYIYNMLVAWTRSRASVRRMECRFRANVFAGDRVIVNGTVTAARDTEVGREVDCDVWADTAAAGHAIVGTATVLLPLGGRR